MVCQPDTALVDQLPEVMACNLMRRGPVSGALLRCGGQPTTASGGSTPSPPPGKAAYFNTDPLREYDKANLNLVRGHRVRLQV
jgi:hypothetical protein